METKKKHKSTKSNKIIGLRTDLYDSNLSVEQCKNWTCQNFTELLNRPKVKFKINFRALLSLLVEVLFLKP